jgi:hypothetical protein
MIIPIHLNELKIPYIIYDIMFLDRMIYIVELGFSPDEIDTYSVLNYVYYRLKDGREERREYVISKGRGIKKSEFIYFENRWIHMIRN